ncbi:Ppx/GppA family phosphatase [Qipengyuania sp. JC766]|uniref:Ppx/GppA family phosphatase n=1 Tax=Qipengyuania sp. JC766 TaxID=3232139 RepID=UPI00345883A8
MQAAEDAPPEPIAAFLGTPATHAVVDIGSNTVRLVLYGGSPRAPMVLLNEKVTARLGRELGETGRLADEAVDLAMRGLRRFALLIDAHGVEDVQTVATAAVRDAENGPQFLAQVREIGLSPRLLTGVEEALTGAEGIIGAFPGACGIVADLGGGSLELARVAKGVAQEAVSFPLGTLRLPEYRGETDKATRKALMKAIEGAPAMPKRGCLYLVGGTLRALATFEIGETDYPVTDPHGFSLSAKDALAIAEGVAAMTPEDLQARPRVSGSRASTLPDAAILLSALIRKLEPERIVFSSWGIREGLLQSALTQDLRAQDPLLAGIEAFGATRGCSPELARRINAWSRPALKATSDADKRTRLAATILSLASMQIEPNLRVAIATGWALEKRWIGLSAKDRAKIATAIMANGNKDYAGGRWATMLDTEELEEAAVWGLLVRLARRLGGRTSAVFDSSRLRIADGKLILEIESEHAAIFGIPSEKDMALLGEKLALEPEVRTLDALPSD